MKKIIIFVFWHEKWNTLTSKKKKNIVNLKQYFSFLLLIQHDNRIIWILNFLNQKKKKNKYKF